MLGEKVGLLAIEELEEGIFDLVEVDFSHDADPVVKETLKQVELHGKGLSEQDVLLELPELLHGKHIVDVDLALSSWLFRIRVLLVWD